MNLSSMTTDSYRIISILENRIDAAVAIKFKDAVRKESEGAPERVILDLTQVDFIDSSGLGAIVATMKLLAPEHALELAGLSSAVDKVFRLTRMDTIFSLFQTVDEAVAAKS